MKGPLNYSNGIVAEKVVGSRKSRDNVVITRWAGGCGWRDVVHGDDVAPHKATGGISKLGIGGTCGLGLVCRGDGESNGRDGEWRGESCRS